MNKKVLSVIIPIYNTEKYIRQCIDSVINQTYKDLDIILVDDGSTDYSGIIVDEYKSDSRINVIHKKNQGLIKARLDGVRSAKGEFVTFVDADDWIDTNMYSDMMTYVIEKDLDMILCGMNRFYDNGRNYNVMPILEDGFYNQKEVAQRVLPQMLWSDKVETNVVNASLCSKIVKKNILEGKLENASTLNIYYGEDAAVLFPIMLDIKSLYVTHRVYYYHRQREQGNVAPYIRDDMCVEKLFSLYSYLKNNFDEYKNTVLFQKQLDLYFIRLLSLRKDFLENVNENNEVIFPIEDIIYGSKVIVYGAGNVGQAYIRQNEKYHFCEIVQWVDKNYFNFKRELNVMDPKEIKKIKFDFIIIAVQTAGVAREIQEELLSYGIEEKKIIWKATKVRRLIK